ncbi:MAG: hypothetical protein M0R17_09195 [Candidatus Omnitrophica bacterium]|jgi:replicative DNA helicase|nr:hypothetical protein [Candidatus Omnitrophota bacterium]
MSKEDFKNYSYSFKLKLLAILLTDKQFLGEVYDILDPTIFESESDIFLITAIKEYFHKFNELPTIDVIKIKLSKVENTSERVNIVKRFKDVLNIINSDSEKSDFEFIQSEFITFCKNLHLKNAIIECADLLKENNYEEIKRVIDRAINYGTNRDIGLDYNNDSVEDRYKIFSRNPIPTPWPIINDLMQGGSAYGENGELYVIMAASGAGKTWCLSNIGLSALKLGFNVLHYTLEISKLDVSKRYDSILTGIDVKDLSDNLEDIEDEIKKLKGKLFIKGYPTKTASLLTIRAHYQKLILSGFKPDIVILDYADLIKNNRSYNKNARTDEMLENIYEELRGMSGELKIPIWTASQVNREGSKSDIILSSDISGAYSKTMVADFIISLSRKLEDKLNGTGRVHIVKNRLGPDGITFPSNVNLNNGRFEIFEGNSIEGQKVTKVMKESSKDVKQYLLNKFNDLNKNKK